MSPFQELLRTAVVLRRAGYTTLSLSHATHGGILLDAPPSEIGSEVRDRIATMGVEEGLPRLGGLDIVWL